jgi:hypothetical protein
MMNSINVTTINGETSKTLTDKMMMDQLSDTFVAGYCYEIQSVSMYLEYKRVAVSKRNGFFLCGESQ